MGFICTSQISPHTQVHALTSTYTNTHTYTHTHFIWWHCKMHSDPPSIFVASLRRQQLSTGRVFASFPSLTDGPSQQQHSCYSPDTRHVPNSIDTFFSDSKQNSKNASCFPPYTYKAQQFMGATTQPVSDREEPWTQRWWVQALVYRHALGWLAGTHLNLCSAYACKEDAQMSYMAQCQEQRNAGDTCSLEWVKFSDGTDLKKWVLCIF